MRQRNSDRQRSAQDCWYCKDTLYVGEPTKQGELGAMHDDCFDAHYISGEPKVQPPKVDLKIEDEANQALESLVDGGEEALDNKGALFIRASLLASSFGFGCFVGYSSEKTGNEFAKTAMLQSLLPFILNAGYSVVNPMQEDNLREAYFQGFFAECTYFAGVFAGRAMKSL